MLVRHGKTDWNIINRIQGSVDIPLNEEGRAEARRISRHLSELSISAVYSSSLSRSFDTAKAIAGASKARLKAVKELREVDQGLWQGLCVADIKKRYRKQYGLWKASPIAARPPKGESMRDAYDRVVSAVKKIMEKHSGDTICIVSHEIVLSLIKCHLKNISPDNLWDMAPKPGSWEILEI